MNTIETIGLRQKQLQNLGMVREGNLYKHGPYIVKDFWLSYMSDIEWNQFLQQLIPDIQAFDRGHDIKELIKKHSNDEELGAAVRKAFSI